MKPQVPAVGISKQYEDETYVSYDILCECTDPDHAHNMIVEIDADGLISVNISTTLTTPFWSMNRWKQIWTILTTGSIQVQKSVILSKQSALNYSEALRASIERLEK